MRHRGFTLIELLATIAIAAALLTVAGFYIANYVTQAQSDSQARQLSTLNRALEEYRMAGGINYSHSLQGLNTAAKITSVVSALRAGFVGDDGQTHNFLANLGNIDVTKLSATGQGKRFIFIGL